MGNPELNALKSTGVGCRFLEICSQIEILEIANFDAETGKLRVTENTRLSSGGRPGDRSCPKLCVPHATNPVALSDCAETKVRRFSATDPKWREVTCSVNPGIP